MKTLALQGRCSESHLTGGVWKHFTLCSACYLCFQNQKKKSDATCTACQAAKSLKPKLAISSTCDPPYWNEIMSAEVTMDYLLSYSILSLFEYALNWVQPWIPTMQKCLSLLVMLFVSWDLPVIFTNYVLQNCEEDVLALLIKRTDIDIHGYWIFFFVHVRRGQTKCQHVPGIFWDTKWYLSLLNHFDCNHCLTKKVPLTDYLQRNPHTDLQRQYSQMRKHYDYMPHAVDSTVLSHPADLYIQYIFHIQHEWLEM